MSNSTSSRPIMQLIDILGKKWVLRILWELNAGACTFRQLQSRCGDLSPTIINTRIKDLCAANFVVKTEDSGYALTAQGEELIELFLPLNDFATRWMNDD